MYWKCSATETGCYPEEIVVSFLIGRSDFNSLSYFLFSLSLGEVVTVHFCSSDPNTVCVWSPQIFPVS